MENKKSTTGRYNALVWLLLTEYEKDIGYTPSKFVLDTIKPKLIESSKGIPIEICDGTLFDFTITSGFKDYLDLLEDKTYKFENALILISYSKEKYIVRDFYLANLAKQYTCWDTAYIGCDCPTKITTDVFDFIVAPTELPHKLTDIIWNDKI